MTVPTVTVRMYSVVFRIFKNLAKYWTKYWTKVLFCGNQVPTSMGVGMDVVVDVGHDRWSYTHESLFLGVLKEDLFYFLHYLQGPACPSSTTPISPQLKNTYWDYSILLLYCPGWVLSGVN